MNFRFIKSVSTLVGAIIGAGILGLPYALKEIGFPAGLILMLVVGMSAMLLQLMLAELTLRTKSDHQIPGYAGIYKGQIAKRLALAVGLIAGYGIILAYLIGISQVLSALFGSNPIIWGLIFVFIMGSFIYRGIKAVMNLETTLVMIMLLIVLAICLSALPYLDLVLITHFSFVDIGAPYGVLLFAFSGTAVIPQLRRQLIGQEKLFPKVIFLANLLVLIVYALFVFIVLGVSGATTTEVATIGLGSQIGSFMIVLGNLLAIFTISTSFLVGGLSIRRMFQYDYHLHRLPAFILTLIVPVALFLKGGLGFVTVLSLVGGVVIGIEGMIIVLSFFKAQKEGSRRPEWKLVSSKLVGVVMIILFVLGAITTLWQQFI